MLKNELDSQFFKSWIKGFQSILYVEQSVTNRIITIERLESVLASDEVCKFRIRFEDLPEKQKL